MYFYPWRRSIKTLRLIHALPLLEHLGLLSSAAYLISPATRSRKPETSVLVYPLGGERKLSFRREYVGLLLNVWL